MCLVIAEDISKIFSDLPEKLAGPGELAYNLWWSWHPEARMFLKTLDRQLWRESVYNPIKMLKGLPKGIHASSLVDPEYLCYYNAILESNGPIFTA